MSDIFLGEATTYIPAPSLQYTTTQHMTSQLFHPHFASLTESRSEKSVPPASETLIAAQPHAAPQCPQVHDTCTSTIAVLSPIDDERRTACDDIHIFVLGRFHAPHCPHLIVAAQSNIYCEHTPIAPFFADQVPISAGCYYHVRECALGDRTV